MSLYRITTFNLIAIMAIMLSACSEQHLYFSDSLKVCDYDDVDRSEPLTGVPVITEAIGSSSINVADTVICLANSKLDKLFTLYNLDGDSIVSVGLRGKGPSDFTSNRMNRQHVSSGGNTAIWVTDVNAAALKLLSLTRSIEANESCVDTIIAIQPMVKNAYITGDTIIQETISNGNINISLSTIDGKSLFEEPLYRHPVDMSQIFTFYDGSMGVSPDGRYLVIALSSINQLNILDLHTGQRSAVSIGGIKGPDYILNRENMLPVWTYYSGVSLGDKYIYALYENQPYSIGDNENNTGELHIFDYAGNIVRIIPLGRFLYSIAYSDNDNSIYALDDNETVWRYNLSSVGL